MTDITKAAAIGGASGILAAFGFGFALVAVNGFIRDTRSDRKKAATKARLSVVRDGVR